MIFILSECQKRLFKKADRILSLCVLLCLLTTGCQVSTKLAETPDFNEPGGRLFVHQMGQHSTDTKILIDGQEVKDLKQLDHDGVVQKIGEHEIEFKGLPNDSGLSEIDYRINKNRDLHLYYCETDGSFHWYVRPMGEKPPREKSFCQKPE